MHAFEARLLKSFGRSVRSLRKQRQLSQEDLAEAARLSHNCISGIERGVRNPGLLAVFVIARALQASLHELLADAETTTHR